MRAFRWAVRMRGILTREQLRERARTAESLGFDTLVVPDHVVRTPEHGGQLAAVPALMAAADATTTLRVGALVLANDYRNPVLLAKEITTLDLLSGGRVDLGLGAGWSRDDYAALGLRYERPGVRIDRLAEALGLLRRLFTEDRVDHDGRHYQVRAATVLPRPTQRPHPPLLVGGHGVRVLTLAAEHADIVSINFPRRGQDLSADALRERIALIRRASGGRELTLQLMTDMRVTLDAGSAYAEAAARFGQSEVDLRVSPFLCYGSVDALVEKVAELRERFGIGYLRVPEERMASFAPVIARIRQPSRAGLTVASGGEAGL